MGVSYDVFTNAFLSKVTDYNFLSFDRDNRTEIVDEYMKRAFTQFNKICKYDLFNRDDMLRELSIDIAEEDIDEIADIVSEGMLVQWMKPYVYKAENLENILNTKDFTSYSPAELLLRVSDTYKELKKSFTNMMREYSYNHGDLTDLHI